ncbi:TIGR02281 family clan AA aspartic protease [Collimonas pratensis]|uniref:Clan AA aspartic protease, TIGR02281 family protein n=1 Tax=Collimonas pratensis TaxID=279113 RepID=A0A127Q1B7_9BURK|nr:TIGR02281 family clan AA aspartic protease [Collimonas pratensis]AMP03625.1 clan AA aspartic protease, TIGR02281 family protein [Collimonas pratensis]NKI68174.1 TIGR02281 family clan AA aspartic protease [Collimonas pratensis]
MRPFVLITSLLLSASLAPAAQASDIGVVGLFPGKAVLVIDGSSPKTYSVGSKVTDDVKLVEANGSSATLEVKGKRQVIGIGEYVSRSMPGATSSVTLKVNPQGHFVADAQINGAMMTMLVDTGATMIALPASDAARMGVNYKQGRMITVNTANGPAPAYMVKLNTVKIGDIEMNQVDALVQESGLPFALLGMSFLNRTEMRREGEMMVLTKRF